jgi:hypothetical protein
MIFFMIISCCSAALAAAASRQSGLRLNGENGYCASREHEGERGN